jgi:hypothetical protein
MSCLLVYVPAIQIWPVWPATPVENAAFVFACDLVAQAPVSFL